MRTELSNDFIKFKIEMAQVDDGQGAYTLVTAEG